MTGDVGELPAIGPNPAYLLNVKIKGAPPAFTVLIEAVTWRVAGHVLRPVVVGAGWALLACQECGRQVTLKP